MIEQVFNPSFGGTTVVANSITATAALDLPVSCREVGLYNTSATALAVVYVTSQGDDAYAAGGTAPTTTLGFPVPPGQLVRIGVGFGVRKVIRAIASAADGNLWIIPGNGG